MTRGEKPSTADLFEIRNAAIRNVRELSADAELLFQANRLPRAFALAVLAMEQFTTVLLFILMANSKEAHHQTWREVDRAIGRRTPKLVTIGIMGRRWIRRGEQRARFESALKAFGQGRDADRQLQAFKTNALYVPTSAVQAFIPSAIISAEMAHDAVEVALGLCAVFDAGPWEKESADN